MTSIEKAAFPKLPPKLRRCLEPVKNVSVTGCETIRRRIDGTRHINHIQIYLLILGALLPIPFWSQPLRMCPDAKVEKVYLYPKPTRRLPKIYRRPRLPGRTRH